MRPSPTRRMLLRGTAGAVLPLPFLPSLVERRAFAADPPAPKRPRFVAIDTQHGGIRAANMVPADATLTTTTPLFTGHDVRSGKLALAKSGDAAQLSAVMRAPAATFTDRLVGKMNVLRGFDVPYYIGHHTGGHLGNFARSDQGPAGIEDWPTIDQVMAWSPSFYGPNAAVRERSIATGQDFRGVSWTWSNPQARSGTIDKVPVETSAQGMFDKLFGTTPPPSGPAAPPPRKPIVDRVLASYKRLRESDRRLSADDKRRLDDHLARLAELERKLSSTTNAPVGVSCGARKRPEDNLPFQEQPAPKATKFFQLLNDVIAMAFACDASRIVTNHIHLVFSDYTGNWHQDVAHNFEADDKQAILVAGLQQTFAGAILDLAAKLDAVEDAPGVSVLDQTLLQWTQESGPSTHDAQDMTIVTFGSAGGYLRTGLFVDYRNLSKTASYAGKQMGLQHRQWLATALQAMGVPRSEWERNAQPGYGATFRDAAWTKAVHPDVFARSSDPIPVVASR